MEIDEVVTENKLENELILESSMNSLIIKENLTENNIVEKIPIENEITIETEPVELTAEQLFDNLEQKIDIEHPDIDIEHPDIDIEQRDKPMDPELSTELPVVVCSSTSSKKSPPQIDVVDDKRNHSSSSSSSNDGGCDNFNFTVDNNSDNEDVNLTENNTTNETTTEFFHSEPVIVELARHSFPWDKREYIRGCIWSPDGTCLLMAVNENGMHVMELPIDLYNIEEVNADRPVTLLKSAVYVPGHTTVYDLCWYPFMNSSDPATCCWLATRSLEPIHMWDAFTGERRGTYRGYDAADEVEPAFSVSFSVDGARVIGGYKRTIKIFQTNVPGRDYQTIPIKSTSSSICVNNGNENLLAVGSWNSMIRLYDFRDTTQHIDTLTNGQRCGITQMKFTADGEYLVTGSRKENKLLIWDLRVLNKPMRTLKRNVSTNQRIYFDISKCDNWLVSGDTSGHIHIWDFQSILKKTGQIVEYQLEDVHEDCCNGISLHPTRKILATGTGQYHADRNFKYGIENDVCLWWYGKSIIDS